MKTLLAAISRRARPPRLKRLKPVSDGPRPRDSRSVPDGASCSRWFSCTCCMERTASVGTAPEKMSLSRFLKKEKGLGSRTTAPTSSSPAPIRDHPRTTVYNVPSPPLPPAKAPPHPPPFISPFPPRWTRSPLNVTGTHLLLPPPLPYSPDSIPFKRHQQALSLALGSQDPDDSWQVYQALHDDLKRHVNDDLYCALVRHQLEGAQDFQGQELEQFLFALNEAAPVRHTGRASSPSGSTMRLQRVYELLSFARECRMPFDRLPFDTLLTLASVDFRPLDIAHAALASLMMHIWQSLARMVKGDLSGVPVASRRQWVEMVLPSDQVKGRRQGLTREEQARVRLFHAVPTKEQRVARKLEARAMAREQGLKCVDQLGEAFEALKFLASHQGFRGLDDVSRRLLTWTDRKTPPHIHTALVRIAQLAEIQPQLITQRIIQTLFARLARCQASAFRAFTRRFEDPIQRIATACPALSSYLDGSWDILRIRFLPPDRQIESIAKRVTISKATLVSKAIKSLYRTSGATGKSRAMDGALTALWTISWDQRQQSIPLIRAIIRHLSLSSQPNFYAPRVQRLVHILVVSDTLNQLPASLFAHLFAICVRANTTSMTSLALKLYEWDMKPPQSPKWMDWSKLSPGMFSEFLQSLFHLGTPHVSLASRVYTDYISAGLIPRSDDALAMIKAICQAPQQSRNLLLERHVKDWLVLKIGARVDLVTALVEGLIQNSKADDAWFAFRVSNRILRGRFLPLELVDQIFEVMMLDPSLENIARCACICQRMADPRVYYVRLMELLSTELEGSVEFTESRRRLALAKHFYADLARRNLAPPPILASLLIREMAQAGETDLALENFMRCLERGIKMNERVAVTLIVRLSMKSKFDEAENVARLSSEQDEEGSRGQSERMRGARAYLDTRRGMKVESKGVEEWVEAAKGRTIGVGGPRVESMVSPARPDEASRSRASQHTEGELESQQWDFVTRQVWKAGAVNVLDNQASWSHNHGPGVIFD